jgi:phosphohistidine swiveling domain-containing protein
LENVSSPAGGSEGVAEGLGAFDGSGGWQDGEHIVTACVEEVAVVRFDHRAGLVHGEVGEDILVLRNLAPTDANLTALVKAKCVITEEGGQLAHLAQVALERAVPMVRVLDATKRYRKGQQLRVDAERGIVSAWTPTHNDENENES